MGKTSQSFVTFIVDALSPLGPVTARPMFGGYGAYLNGLIFGLIDDDQLFFKVDDETRPRFEAAGGVPFTYPGKKGPMTMRGYWTAPESALDDHEELVSWARLALEASARSEKDKKKATPKTKTAGAKSAGAKSASAKTTGRIAPKSKR